MSDNDSITDDSENERSSEASSRQPTAAPEGWSKEEKFRLLQAIKAFGSSNISFVTDHVDTKTLEEVTQAIEFYKKKANAARPRHLLSKARPNTAFAKTQQLPLSSWANLLTENIEFGNLQNETATAFRLIAEFESIPKANETCNISFRELYQLVANALDGKSLQGNDLIQSVIEKSLIETALFSKSFMRNSTFNLVTSAMTISDAEFHNFPRFTKDDDLTNIRHLSAQRAYNPFGISEQYLKPESINK
ncbi:uncharacterized protein LOC119690416 [Plutella xylostella]|uniref:uncharacterized protein LOC119690416 n=1 Tax=Plutella xylostella TaxID=51655 RepID=UPI002032F9F8|nr:uncharacterized protein LOC119690416 [Plutella xylostella]